MAGVCSGDGPCVTTPLGPSQKPWIAKVGGLPLYIRAIAQALQRNGHSESSAIATAVATVKRWAAGGGNVSAATRARAAAAVAEWESKKAASHSLTAEPSNAVDLASSGGHHVPGTGYEWRHGYIPLTLEVAKANKKGAHLVPKGGHDKSKARVAIRPGSHEGQGGHHIVGTDAHGRRVRAFAPGDRSNAAKAADNIRAGRPAFERNLVPASSVGSKPSSAPASVKRGDLVVLHEKGSTFTTGPGGGYREDNRYHIGVASSVGRDGMVKEVTHRWGSSEYKQKVDPARHKVLIVGGRDKVDIPAALAAGRKNTWQGHPDQTKPFESIDEVRAAIRPHVKAKAASLTADDAPTVDLAWDEAQHPRVGGKFAPKGTQTQGAQPKPPTTGQINPALAAQIRDFQKRMGLPVTGNFDQATVAKIQAVRTAKGGGGGGKGKGGGKGGASKGGAAAKKQQAATKAYLKAQQAAAKKSAAQQKAAAAKAAKPQSAATKLRTAASKSPALQAYLKASAAAHNRQIAAGKARTAQKAAVTASNVKATAAVAAKLAHH